MIRNIKDEEFINCTQDVGQMSPGAAFLTADVALRTVSHLQPQEFRRPTSKYRFLATGQERFHTANLTPEGNKELLQYFKVQSFSYMRKDLSWFCS